VVRKDEESGQFSTVYEVFDTPYEDEPSTGESEEVQDLPSGEAQSGALEALPLGGGAQRLIGAHPEEGMVQDLPAIAHTFSCRSYGLRRYEKTLKDELAGGGR
jgi:hypothetical protein